MINTYGRGAFQTLVNTLHFPAGQANCLVNLIDANRHGLALSDADEKFMLDAAAKFEASAAQLRATIAKMRGPVLHLVAAE